MGKYFTERERYQLEILLKNKTSIAEISKLLNKCKATIYNEIKRGTVTLLNHDYTERTLYQADVAQRKYDEIKVFKGRTYKIGNDYSFLKFVTEMITEKKYSPCAVLAYIKNNHIEFHTDICFKTLYNYIEKGVFLGLSRNSLPMPRKARKTADNKRTVALNSLSLRSIEERPDHIGQRASYGDWEMDTVVSGRGGTGVLLVLTERMTRQEIIKKLPDKTMASVCTALNSLENEMGVTDFINTFKTITMDNGTEFKDVAGIETSCTTSQQRTTTYYCHPYSSWERGSNENANKLIRRWIPKGADISQYSVEFIQYVQDWINNYPRKIFNYLSSNEILSKCSEQTPDPE